MDKIKQATMRYITIILFLASLMIIAGCTGDSVTDPTLVNKGFRGITYTNEEGEIIGPADLDDWHLSSDDNTFLAPKAGDNYQVLSAGNGLPADFSIDPAYPNPNNGVFYLQFCIPTYVCCFSAVIINDNYRILARISCGPSLGISRMLWTPEIAPGQKLPPGIYRVIYSIGLRSGYGDIWIK
jgi:hypothetical protein